MLTYLPRNKICHPFLFTTNNQVFINSWVDISRERECLHTTVRVLTTCMEQKKPNNFIIEAL